MPLTKKGQTILTEMTKRYGSRKKALEVFYAMANSGKLKGVHKGKK